ncbi:MAG: hypothetical protein AAF213_01860 [Pseudomonadota bacterium]
MTARPTTSVTGPINDTTSGTASATLTGQPSGAAATNRQVFVLFTGKTELRWLGWLKPGFRHCLAVIDDGAGWLLFDPLAGYFWVERLAVPPGWDLPGYYESVGYTVVSAQTQQPARQAPPGPMTCVEAIKRLLGLHKPLIITPHQLYRHLRKATASHPHSHH